MADVVVIVDGGGKEVDEVIVKSFGMSMFDE